MNLITGGLGFIGSHLTKKIDAKIYDRKDEETFRNFIGQYNTIFHLAASTYLTIGYDEQIIKDNIILSDRICRRHCQSRFIYASSAAIYNPNNLYSYSKKYCEDLFSNYDAIGLRYYNVYGQGDNGIVGKLIKAAYTGDMIPIYGGNQTRDFVYIDDVVSMTLQAVNSEASIIEVGTGISTSINDLIKMIEDITNRKINVSYNPRIEFEAENSKCEYGHASFTKLYDGLKETIRQYDKRNQRT